MAAKVPQHQHQWYPISHDQDGQVALWACAGARACIRTLTPKQRKKGDGPDAQELPGWYSQEERAAYRGKHSPSTT